MISWSGNNLKGIINPPKNDREKYRTYHNSFIHPNLTERAEKLLIRKKLDITDIEITNMIINKVKTSKLMISLIIPKAKAMNPMLRRMP